MNSRSIVVVLASRLGASAKHLTAFRHIYPCTWLRVSLGDTSTLMGFLGTSLRNCGLIFRPLCCFHLGVIANVHNACQGIIPMECNEDVRSHRAICHLMDISSSLEDFVVLVG
ncbi:hypothetical protein BJX61DRAFT_112 [Aspergillus egyptiacus]|nr:hypothetical protein BJX61DRAFT_112 [Aspergillus egyptiacus]